MHKNAHKINETPNLNSPKFVLAKSLILTMQYVKIYAKNGQKKLIEEKMISVWYDIFIDPPCIASGIPRGRINSDFMWMWVQCGLASFQHSSCDQCQQKCIKLSGSYVWGQCILKGKRRRRPKRDRHTHTHSQRKRNSNRQAGKDRHAEKEPHLKTYRKNANRYRQEEIDRQKQRQTDTDTHRNIRKQRDTWKHREK